MIEVERVEKKYPVNVTEIGALKKRLSIYMKTDPNNGQQGYVVRSLYFDSLYDMDYQAKVDGIDFRKKIRLRIYNPKDLTAKLEVKEKTNGYQRKRSIVLSRENALEMINGDYSCLKNMDSSFAQALYCIMTKEVYRPKVVVEYDRYAFIHDDNNIRVTFDSNIRCTESNFNIFDSDLVLYPLQNMPHVTMEVKYNNFLLSGIKEMLAGRMTLEYSNGKYINSRKITKG